MKKEENEDEKSEEETEESELEEELTEESDEEFEEIEEPEFREFSRGGFSKGPSLGRINISEERIVDLEESLEKETHFDEKKKEGEEFKYNAGDAKYHEEKQYIQGGEIRENAFFATDVEELGREKFRQEVGWKNSRDEKEPAFERKYDAKRTDIDELGKDIRAEKRGVEYKSSR